ncbi:MAG: succinate--CoA ligase subunit beta [Alphaproteobacteria bacterium]|nr:succinate--CoA ligase subunit beta [Alphaproteobacteria bacterium]
MNIHEYQAKKILSQYDITIPKGAIAYTPASAKKIADEIAPRGPWMLKSQIHSGARNNGYFIENEAGKKGGIRKVESKRELIKESEKMFGNTLVTIQTGPKGKIVNKIYVEAYTKVKNLFYAGMVIDRMEPAVTLLVGKTEDDDIIKVTLNNPEKILKIKLSLDQGPNVAQVRQVLNFLELPSNAFKNLKKFINGIHKAFIQYDATLIEINPAGLTKSGEIIALDAKMSFDDASLYRHDDIKVLKDEGEYIERNLKASKYGFDYEEFDGSVGLIVNGDGISLALIDLLQQQGFDAACALNVKGGVDKDKIAAGVKIIMTNPKVEGILINILGGFVRCNLIADGIVSATSEVGLNSPLVVRFEGVNKEYAKEILEKSKLPMEISEDMLGSVDNLIKIMKEND